MENNTENGVGEEFFWEGKKSYFSRFLYYPFRQKTSKCRQ
jgi:hypothetical protein